MRIYDTYFLGLFLSNYPESLELLIILTDKENNKILL
jgi:hypothetical protein